MNYAFEKDSDDYVFKKLQSEFSSDKKIFYKEKRGVRIHPLNFTVVLLIERQNSTQKFFSLSM
jgi:hypothetical protein